MSGKYRKDVTVQNMTDRGDGWLILRLFHFTLLCYCYFSRCGVTFKWDYRYDPFPKNGCKI